MLAINELGVKEDVTFQPRDIAKLVISLGVYKAMKSAELHIDLGVGHQKQRVVSLDGNQ
jgi:hypothetical protein